MSQTIEIPDRDLLLFLFYKLNRKVSTLDTLIGLVFVAQRSGIPFRYQFEKKSGFMHCERLLEDLEGIIAQRMIIETLTDLERDPEIKQLSYKVGLPDDERQSFVKLYQDKLNSKDIIEQISNFTKTMQKGVIENRVWELMQESENV